jgi:phosphatidylethanolamine/phosphatidyl-N-methylethanolamine N-methyltransferase
MDRSHTRTEKLERWNRPSAGETERPPSGAAIFFRGFLKDPVAFGSAFPSGRQVGRALVRHLELERPGDVIELGAGTGNLTKALLDAGCPPSRLVLIERDRELVHFLRQRYPDLCIIGGDAGRLGELLGAQGVSRAATIVSSLPITWFKRTVQGQIVGEALRLLRGGPFLQLTNAFASPLAPARFGLAAEQVARVWLNFLPIQIWRYRQRAQVER